MWYMFRLMTRTSKESTYTAPSKDRMYLNVLIKVGIKEGFISILLTPER